MTLVRAPAHPRGLALERSYLPGSFTEGDSRPCTCQRDDGSPLFIPRTILFGELLPDLQQMSVSSEFL